jgi:3-hydroxyacyl-[acyl-carrier-protein] dehydratase
VNPTLLDIPAIMKVLPHRYPFLLVDRVVELDPGKSLTAIKNVTYNEPFFPGHFPHVPTMPGVLILEALAQAAGILAVLRENKRAEDGLLLYFAGIDEARFRRPVIPGDTLALKVELLAHKRDMWKFSGRAFVGTDLAAEATLLCVLREPGKKKVDG